MARFDDLPGHFVRFLRAKDAYAQMGVGASRQPFAKQSKGPEPRLYDGQTLYSWAISWGYHYNTVQKYVRRRGWQEAKRHFQKKVEKR